MLVLFFLSPDDFIQAGDNRRQFLFCRSGQFFSYAFDRKRSDLIYFCEINPSSPMPVLFICRFNEYSICRRLIQYVFIIRDFPGMRKNTVAICPQLDAFVIQRPRRF